MVPIETSHTRSRKICKAPRRVIHSMAAECTREGLRCHPEPCRALVTDELKSEEIIREHLVVQRPRPSLAAAIDGTGGLRPKVPEDQRRHQRRAIQPHPAMREDAVAGADQVGAECRDCVEAGQVGKLAVVDRKVDVEEVAGDLGDALIDAAFEIDDGVDLAIENRLPVFDGGGEEKLFVIVDGDDAEKAGQHIVWSRNHDRRV